MRILAAVAVVVVGALAGCGSGGGTQQPTSPIPPVQKPRDVAAMASRPCDLLTPQQAAKFGLDRPPRRLPGVLGKVDCEWRSSMADVWVYISTSPNKSTLEDIYARRASLPYFQLTQLSGYPATAVRSDPRLPVCDVDLKAAEGQSVTVSYDTTKLDKEPQQGCVTGKAVAQEVLKNLPLKR
jgi:hypothetical protein